MTPSTKNLKILTAIIFIIVVISVGFFIFTKMNQATTDSTKNHDPGDVAAASEDLPVKVEADSARIGDLVMRLSATGLTRVRNVNYQFSIRMGAPPFLPTAWINLYISATKILQFLSQNTSNIATCTRTVDNERLVL